MIPPRIEFAFDDPAPRVVGVGTEVPWREVIGFDYSRPARRREFVNCF